MRHIFIFIYLFSFIHLQAQPSVSSDNWHQYPIQSFEILNTHNILLLHPSFLLHENLQNAKTIKSEDFYTGFIYFQVQSDSFFTCKLANDNFLKLNIRILSPDTAALYNLKCECNLGIERSIFNHNPNPSTEKIADITIKDGQIHCKYSEHFQQEFLNLSPFAKEFFKDHYQVYVPE